MEGARELFKQTLVTCYHGQWPMTNDSEAHYCHAGERKCVGDKGSEGGRVMYM